MTAAIAAALRSAHEACRCRWLGKVFENVYGGGQTFPCRVIQEQPEMTATACVHADCGDPLHAALDDLARAIEAAA